MEGFVSEMQNLPACTTGRLGKFPSLLVEGTFLVVGEIFYFNGRFCTSVNEIKFIVDVKKK